MSNRDPARWATRQLKGHTQRVQALAWSCDGKRLASVSLDTTIRVWMPERADYRSSTKLDGHTGTIASVCWDPSNPERLASCSGDSTVRVWDIRQGKAILTYKSPPTRPAEPTAPGAKEKENLGPSFLNITWSPDARYIAVGNKADLITLLDASTLEPLASISNTDEANEVIFSNNSNYLYITVSGRIRVVSVPAMEDAFEVFAHQTFCETIDVDPYGRYVAAGSNDALVSLWDVEDWACVRTFSRSEAPVHKVSFSFDGELLAVTTEDVIDLYYVETGRLFFIVKIPSPRSAVWHPFKRILAYICNDDATIRVTGV